MKTRFSTGKAGYSLLALLGVVCAMPQATEAATTATATVTYTVSSVSAITVSGNPATMVVSPPNTVTDASTTYSVTTNGTNQKITGAISAALPTGVSLATNLAAPTGGTSAGTVTLGTTAANLVTGISGVAQSSLGITYSLTATAAAAPVTGSTVVVTYTITP